MERITVEMAPGRKMQPGMGACPQGCRACVFSTNDPSVFGEYSPEQLKAFEQIQDRFRIGTLLVIPPGSVSPPVTLRHAPEELDIVAGRLPATEEHLDQQVKGVLQFAHDLLSGVMDGSGFAARLAIGNVIPPLRNPADWRLVGEQVDTILAQFITIFGDHTPASFRLALDINDLSVSEFDRLATEEGRKEMDHGFENLATQLADDGFSDGYVEVNGELLEAHREFYLAGLSIELSTRMIRRLKDREQAVTPITRDNFALALFPEGVWVCHSVKNRHDPMRWLRYDELAHSLEATDPIQTVISRIEERRKEAGGVSGLTV